MKRGLSSAGRAPALHAGGQEFESPSLQKKGTSFDVPFLELLGSYNLEVRFAWTDGAIILGNRHYEGV